MLTKGDAQAINELAEALKEGLNKRGRFVLPLNYVGKEGSSGHAFACVFDKTPEGKIVCHILNKGEGSECHPVVSKVDYKTKSSYRFFPIVIEDPDYFDKNPEATAAFLQRLSQYSTKMPGQEDKAYNSKEIYRLIAFFAGTNPEKLVRDYQALKFANQTGKKRKIWTWKWISPMSQDKGAGLAPNRHRA